MTFEEMDLQKFHERYMVKHMDFVTEPIEHSYAYGNGGIPLMRYVSGGGSVSTAELTLDVQGFRLLMKDAAVGARGNNFYDWERPFDINKIDDADQYVVRFSLENTDIKQVGEIAERLSRMFPSKTFVFLPKDIEMETTDTNLLEKLRDMISSIIEARDYDNLMGVTENT